MDAHVTNVLRNSRTELQVLHIHAHTLHEPLYYYYIITLHPQ